MDMKYANDTLSNNKVIEMAINEYMRRFSRFTLNAMKQLNGLQLRQEHVKAKFDAVDYVRKNSVGHGANVWKLERDLEVLFVQVRTNYTKSKLVENKRCTFFVDSIEKQVRTRDEYIL